MIKFRSDGTFSTQWGGPGLGFYRPRDVAIGPNRQLYILDQGRTRVVRLDPESAGTFEWGRSGTGEGEFSDLTGITIGGDRIFIADAKNDRIQVFDLDGKFIRQWAVGEWDKYIWHYPDVAFDEQSKRLYVTSGWTNEVLVFCDEGRRLKSLPPAEPAKLNNPSSLVLTDSKSEKRLYVLNTGSYIVNTGSVNVSIFELGNAMPR